MFCNSGLRWSAYSYCVLQFRVALVCVFLLCLATQGCAGLRILIAICNSGLRWSAYSYCLLQFRVALVCVFLLCFAIQGCAGRLRIRIAICNSGLRWSTYYYCVSQFRVALVCVFLSCFAIQGRAGLRVLIVFCNSWLKRTLQRVVMDTPKRSETGLKPFETVGKQLYLLILHLHGN